jgi:aminomethyltransferase
VGLTIGSAEDVAHGDGIFAGRAQVGVVTSATRSPVLRAHIALARVDVGFSAVGQKLEIGKLDGMQKRLPAVVTPFPHYDPKKTRVRA